MARFLARLGTRLGRALRRTGRPGGRGGGAGGPDRPGRGVTVLTISWPAVRRRIPGVLAVLLLVYAAASAVYLHSFRVVRTREVVVVAAEAELLGDVERLARAFRAETGREVAVVDAGSSTAPELLARLASGSVDAVFAGASAGGAPASGGRVYPRRPAFYRAALLAVRFPSPHTDLSLEEARRAVEDLRAGRPGPWPEAGLEAIGLRDRTPDRQLLAVDGVYPTLETVCDGTYPLSEEVFLWLRPEPRGPLSLLYRLPPVRRLLRPNDESLREFVVWLESPGLREAVYGTPAEVSLTAVGDVWFARNVGRLIDEKGLHYPFELVADRLRSADLTWCNLESPLGTTGAPLPGKMIWFRARPETVECLRHAGMDVVALANNHILDYDSPCLLETLDLLEASGIAYCGAGRDMDEARRPAVLEVEGLKVAFLAYTEYADPGLFWDANYPRTFMAGEGVPGCAPLDMEMVAEDIERARALADLVVVGYHWGREDEPYPVAYHPWNDLRAIARRTVDLGACLVLGTHPHAVQGYEVRGRGLIAYSLGNFVTDQVRDMQREGVILELQLGRSGVLSARIVPVWSEGFRPRLMTEEEARALLEKIQRLSWVYRQPR